MERLEGMPVRLTVAGEGPDFAELKRRCGKLMDKVEFLGRVSADSVPGLLAGHDAFLMTSRYEGLPYTLIEALAAGCVPVASRIAGVTDFVVKHEETGLLFPVGDTAAAVGQIQRLAGDGGLLARMSVAGQADCRERFSIPAMAEGYMRAIDSLRDVSKLPKLQGLRVGQPYEILPMGGGWRKYVPNGIKNLLRRHMYR
jgi:glycosyltransferase involved in cell wall biosynthesis